MTVLTEPAANTTALPQAPLIFSDSSDERIRADALNDEAWNIRNINTNNALVLATEAYEISQRIGYDLGRAYASSTLGLRANFLGDVEGTMRYAYEAMAVFDEHNDTVGLTRVYFLLAFSYWGFGNYDEGLQYAFRGVDMARANNDQEREAWCLYALGTFYFDLHDYGESLQYYNRGLEISLVIGDIFAEARIINGIGNVCLGLNDLDRAREYFERSLKLARMLDNDAMIARALDDLGVIYQRQGNTEASLLHFHESLALRERVGHKRGVITTLINMATLFIKQKQYDDAILVLQKSLVTSEELGAKPRMYRIHQLFAEIYEHTGNDSRALWHFKTFHRIREEVNGDQHNLRYKSLQNRHQAERAEKEAEIFRLKNVELAEVNARLGEAYALVEDERHRAETLLLNVLPPSIAERIKSGEQVIADKFEDVTVVFVDIVGFTQLSSNNDPREIVEMLNWIFSVFDALTERFGLEKIKTIGDAYMIASGVPTRRADHAEAAAQMALAIVQEFRSFSEQSGLTISGRAADVRVGMHCGPVVAGVIGKKKFIYDLWGDTVNIASRMESHGEPGKVHISEEVFRRLDSKRFRCEERGVIEVKGKGVMKTFFLNEAS